MNKIFKSCHVSSSIFIEKKHWRRWRNDIKTMKNDIIGVATSVNGIVLIRNSQFDVFASKNLVPNCETYFH